MKVVLEDFEGNRRKVEVRSATVIEPGVQVRVVEIKTRGEVVVTRHDPKGTIMRDGMVNHVAIDCRNGAVSRELQEMKDDPRGATGVYRDATGPIVKVMQDNRPATIPMWRRALSFVVGG